MLVKADGTALGTVGGGAVEYQVTLACREAVKSKESSLREFTLTRGKEAVPSAFTSIREPAPLGVEPALSMIEASAAPSPLKRHFFSSLNNSLILTPHFLPENTV